MVKASVKPQNLKMCKNECNYDDGNVASQSHKAISFYHGILTCNSIECINKAKRDNNACLHQFKCARISDILPMFPKIDELSSVSVVRTDNTITIGCSIIKNLSPVIFRK